MELSFAVANFFHGVVHMNLYLLVISIILEELLALFEVFDGILVIFGARVVPELQLGVLCIVVSRINLFVNFLGQDMR